MANYKSIYTGAEIDAGIGKANTALQEHQPLKTVNNESLVGDGNITIEGTSYEAGNNIQISEENVISATDTIYDDTELREAIAGKQEELISGTNIKTINGNSILGEGNLVIEGGEGGLTSVAHDDTLTGAGTNENPLGINTTKIAQKSDIPAEVTEETVSSWGFTKNTGTYSKPDTGIPKTDLTSDIQTSLEKADTALQEHQDISGKVDKVDGKGLSSNDFTNEEKAKLDNIDMSEKQDTLVSGTNIKTINHKSILGEGNINIPGGSGTTEVYIGDTQPTDDETLWIDTSKTASNNTSYLKTLKVGILGDSITYGYGVDHDTQSYPALLKEDFGEVINYGISSTLVGTGWGTNAMCTRYVNMRNDLDIVIVMGGTNDFAKRAEMGTATETFGDFSSTNTNTFYGALNVLMSGLNAKYPGKRIFFCSPIHISYGGYTSDTAKANGKTLYDYRDAIKEMCTKYSITFIDTMSISGMDIAHNASARTLFTTDGCHPNVTGHQRLHDVIFQAVKNSIGELEYSKPVVLKYKNGNSWEILSDRAISPASVPTLSSISAVYTQGQTVIYPSTSLNSLKEDLVVTATYSDGTTNTLNDNDYTLSGTLSVGTSTITVSYQNKTTTFTVIVTAEPTLSSIEATYTQGQKVVYPSTPLNNLKEDLVVVAYYDNQTSKTLEDSEYTLSGTLTQGTSTITATYETESDTFTVTVSAEPPYIPLAYIAGNGSSYIDTAVLANQDTKFSIECSIDSNPESQGILLAYGNNSHYFGINTFANKFYYDYNEDYIDKSYTYDGQFKTISNEKNEIFVDGVSIGTTGTYGTFSLDTNLFMFALNNKNNAQIIATNKIKIKSCKIWNGNTLIRDFVAAKFEGVVGMWDKVSDTLYSSATGTPFTEPTV